ncbi:MAG: glycosyltransferase family 2 protein, partial [Acidimicrobiales bacterium]
SEGWMEAMLEHAMRPQVGAVGARLYHRDGRVQHEGIFVGTHQGWAVNIDHHGFRARGDLVRNCSAVTGACTMIRPSVYWRVGGNDERLRVAYNDVDLCLRIRQAGFQVVYTPYAQLYHHESATRSGYEHPEDGPLFGERWRPREMVDPYLGPMFERNHPFQIRV